MSRRQITAVTQKIAIALAALQREAADAGMLRTMHSMNRASQVLGWEAARMIELLAKRSKKK